MQSTIRPRCMGILAVSMFLLCSIAGTAKSGDPQDYSLFNAIRRGDLALLASHLREGTPLNVQTADGTTPLMVAALHGTPEVLGLLLRHGADPNAVSKDGATALLFAAGDLHKVRLLIDGGAQVNVHSALGNTPLIAAASHGDNLSVVKLLLDKGADLHVRNKNDVSALTAAVLASDADAVQFFLDRGAKPGPVKFLFNGLGNSLLQLAAQVGNNKTVELLLKHGVDVNESDSSFAGHALNYALLSEKPDVAMRLIDAGADLKKSSPIGKVPPILLAVYSENGNVSLAKAIIERGADVTASNKAGETALTWARRRGFLDAIALLAGVGTPDPADIRPEMPNRQLPQDEESRRQLVRAAIEKSIVLLQHSSDVFLEARRSCVSCHHQNLPSVALGWARDRGFAIAETSTGRIADRTLNSWSRRVESAYEMDRPFPAPPQLLGYGLWGLSALGQAADSVTEAAVWYLAESQRSDGHWAGGTILRPPMGGDDVLSTALAMRALQLYPLQGRREETALRVGKARRWLTSAKPIAHQELVFKLLGLAWAGTPVEELQDDLQRLKTAQQPDGGWSQLPHLSSDAWATAQSLVALRVAGQLGADPATQHGIDYLLRTQFDDGAWYVQSRAWPFQPPFESGFPFGRDQWISAGATAWAMMALLLEVEPGRLTVVPTKSNPRPTLVAASAATPKKAAPAESTVAPDPKQRAEPVEFVRAIKPILERSCAGCHSGEKPEGGFRVIQRESLLLGGESGEPAVVTGQSAQSPMFAKISANDPELAMPPLDKRDKFAGLSADEIELFRKWIDEGAKWPDGIAIKAK